MINGRTTTKAEFLHRGHRAFALIATALQDFYTQPCYSYVRWGVYVLGVAPCVLYEDSEKTPTVNGSCTYFYARSAKRSDENSVEGAKVDTWNNFRRDPTKPTLASNCCYGGLLLVKYQDSTKNAFKVVKRDASYCSVQRISFHLEDGSLICETLDEHGSLSTWSWREFLVTLFLPPR